MDIGDIKEKLVVVLVMTGIFLPTRLAFSAYVSEHWVGSLGLISAMAILLVVLIRKNKLGMFGKIFEKQITKMLYGRTGKIVMICSILFTMYFGTTLYLMDQGNSVYLDDKQVFYDALFVKSGNSEISTNELTNLQEIAKNKEFGLVHLDYAFSLSYALMNDVSKGWLQHLHIVLLVEQLEIIGMLLFYRIVYLKSSRPVFYMSK